MMGVTSDSRKKTRTCRPADRSSDGRTPTGCLLLHCDYLFRPRQSTRAMGSAAATHGASHRDGRLARARRDRVRARGKQRDSVAACIGARPRLRPLRTARACVWHVDHVRPRLRAERLRGLQLAEPGVQNLICGLSLALMDCAIVLDGLHFRLAVSNRG